MVSENEVDSPGKQLASDVGGAWFWKERYVSEGEGAMWWFPRGDVASYCERGPHREQTGERNSGNSKFSLVITLSIFREFCLD